MKRQPVQKLIARCSVCSGSVCCAADEAGVTHTLNVSVLVKLRAPEQREGRARNRITYTPLWTSVL